MAQSESQWGGQAWVSSMFLEFLQACLVLLGGQSSSLKGPSKEKFPSSFHANSFPSSLPFISQNQPLFCNDGPRAAYSLFPQMSTPNTLKNVTFPYDLEGAASSEHNRVTTAQRYIYVYICLYIVPFQIIKREQTLSCLTFL